MPDCNRDCNSCGKDCSEREGGIPKTPLNADSHVGKVIGVVSGKGGVGKSSVTSMLAVAAARLEGVSPLIRLRQGYAYVTDEAGKNIRSVTMARPGENIRVRLEDGTLTARVSGPKNAD